MVLFPPDGAVELVVELAEDDELEVLLLLVVELSDPLLLLLSLVPPPELGDVPVEDVVVSFVAAASEDELIPLDPVSVSDLVEDFGATMLVRLAIDPVGLGAGVAAVEDLSSLASPVDPPEDPLLVEDVVDTLSSSAA